MTDNSAECYADPALIFPFMRRILQTSELLNEQSEQRVDPLTIATMAVPLTSQYLASL
jgi:hypothetical protein